MQNSLEVHGARGRDAANKGKLIGPKPPFRPAPAVVTVTPIPYQYRTPILPTDCRGEDKVAAADSTIAHP
jgi:hypothetical protein